MTGWQGHIEVSNIKTWEEIQEIDNILSRNYDDAIRKFGMRGYTEVSAITSSNNAKEVKLKSEIELHILDLPQEIIEKAIANNKLVMSTEKRRVKPLLFMGVFIVLY
jgi:hypothetical protein